MGKKLFNRSRKVLSDEQKRRFQRRNRHAMENAYVDHAYRDRPDGTDVLTTRPIFKESK